MGPYLGGDHQVRPVAMAAQHGTEPALGIAGGVARSSVEKGYAAHDGRLDHRLRAGLREGRLRPKGGTTQPEL